MPINSPLFEKSLEMAFYFYDSSSVISHPDPTMSQKASLLIKELKSNPDNDLFISSKHVEEMTLSDAFQDLLNIHNNAGMHEFDMTEFDDGDLDLSIPTINHLDYEHSLSNSLSLIEKRSDDIINILTYLNPVPF